MVETFSWDFFLRASCLLEENSSKLAGSRGTYYSPFAVWLPPSLVPSPTSHFQSREEGLGLGSGHVKAVFVVGQPVRVRL